MRYPEHQKLKLVHKHTQFAYDFKEFCEQRGVYMMADGEDVELKRKFTYMISAQTFDNLLAKFIGVDLEKLEKEKLAMLAALRK